MKKISLPLPSDEASAQATVDDKGLVADIGEALRSRRRLLRLSIVEVAKRSELSIGYISLLERNLASPSLTALMRIGQVLGLEMDYFFQTRNVGGHHFPRSARTPFQIQAGSMSFDQISGQFAGSVIGALVVTIPPQHKSTPTSHPGEELIYVLSGSLRFKMGNRKLILGAGDSVHLPSTTPHCWENPFAQTATALWVGTAPLFKHDPDEPTSTHGLQDHGSPMGVLETPPAMPKKTRKSTK